MEMIGSPNSGGVTCADTKDKPKDIEATFKKSGSKDKYADKVECENKKQEPSLTNKQNINDFIQILV
ncbi:hypothetical protein GOBAR_AA32517 [Gossypium barbadense]|uniref:Uncharacterized protein n=1 Tax=Gossypium barbadense TaxID=3634 RepID=A0A2P5WAR3_GOSBA|nr:hypothetical protein GOBAR_AA32517 [Gossypium barbadense]